MTSQRLDGSEREARLHEVLLEYVEAVEHGRVPDRRQLLERYPEFACELNEFFASQDHFDRVAAPLRAFTDALEGSSPRLSGAGHVFPSVRSGQKAPEETEAELGQLGDFHLIRELGRGGMGVVYEAEQLSLRRRVALKVLPFAAAFDPKQLQRFKNEAQAAAHLSHPNIVPVFAVGSERGVHYYAMQFIEGQSLATLIKELRAAQRRQDHQHARSAQSGSIAAQTPGPPPAVAAPANDQRGAAGPLQALALSGVISTEQLSHRQKYFQRVAELGVKAANALDHAHQEGVVHRDIKPANLLIDVRGNLWVTDFGLALLPAESGLTITGELLGTVRYMSPEQALGNRALVDHRTDVYSLGVTLYELLTLQPVFDGADRQELLHQIAFDEPISPCRRDRALPAELETIVLKAIEKNPGERYASAKELADDLQRFLDGKPIHARRPTILEKAIKWGRRHQRAVIAATGLLVLALAGLTVSTVLIAQEHAQTKAALAGERQKAKEATEQRARALEGFVQARRAVDFITQIGEDEFASKPRMQQLRKKLLVAALVYYQHFIEQNKDDPTMQPELARSHARAATILSELGSKVDALAEIEQARQIQERVARDNPSERGAQVRLDVYRCHLFVLQGCPPMALLIQKSVQDDLQMSRAQLAKVDALSVELLEQRQQSLRDLHKLDAESQQDRLRELADANEKAVVEILTPAQMKRLDQIGLRVQSLYAFSDPKVADLLQLTSQQKEKIGAYQAETDDAIWKWACSPAVPKPGPRPGEIRKRSLGSMLELLTPEQRLQWNELVGEPFRGEIFLGERGISPWR